MEVSAGVGEEYTSASNHVIYNAGQQTVSAHTDEYVPVTTRFQVTDGNKPLMSISGAYEHDNSVLYFKKQGSWIINDRTNIATRMIHENKKMQVQTPTREVGACTHMHHMWCSTATLLNAPHVVLSPEHHA